MEISEQAKNSFVEIDVKAARKALVDKQDYERVLGITWRAMGKPGNEYIAGIRRGRVWMHRLIMNAPDHLKVDHINGDTFDNRRQNLRFLSNQENGKAFRRKKNIYSSRYFGVFWCKKYKGWAARVKSDGKIHHVGYFEDEKEAATARDLKAIKLGFYPEGLNFPELHPSHPNHKTTGRN